MRKIDCGHLFEVLALLALLAGFWYGAVKLVVWIHPVSRLWP
jgi:hypothetical protein